MIERISMKHLESRAAAAALLRDILSRDVPESALCQLLGELRSHPVSEPLLSGFREAMMERAIPVVLNRKDTIDTCGTGGDGKNTFNISTLSALTVAACGEAVVKHGNSAFSSSVGSSDILQRIGIPLPTDPEVARSVFEKAGAVFLHAPFFHPAMKQIGAVRKKVGFRTIFNLLGPLCNPSSPGVRILGVANYEVFRLYRAVQSRLEGRYGVLWDEGGYDEITLTGRTFLSVMGKDMIVTAADFGTQPVKPSDLHGGNSPDANLSLFLEIASGKAASEKLSVVAANAGTALFVAGKVQTLRDGYEAALAAIRGGEVIKKIELLKASEK